MSQSSKHPLSDEALNGNEIAWTSWGISCYNTNFGQVEVDEKTEKFVSCCIGLGRNQGNTEMTIKITKGEFQITRDSFGAVYAELCSPNYPYKHHKKTGTITVGEVLRMLQKDTNNSVAAIIVKKEIVTLLRKKRMNLIVDDYKEIRELFRIWRKPILKRDLVERKAIIVRTPIITVKEGQTT